MLRNTIRRVVRGARAWLREGEVEDGAPSLACPPNTAYERLNALFTDLVATTARSRPHFAWGILHAAHLAKTLKIDRISAIEFGVAGGNGLLSMEHMARAIGTRLEIQIDVFGFDTGVGLPKPEDYRDLPNIFQEGTLPMDPERLRRNLRTARLILGPVGETVQGFVDSLTAPIGFVSFDLDYYSSTMQAFKIFEADHRVLLPRVHCYFDDIIGFTFSEFTGERLAIAEFNESHERKKISPIFGLGHFLPPPHDRAVWPEQMYLAHLFEHELYGAYDGLIVSYVGGFDLVGEGSRSPSEKSE